MVPHGDGPRKLLGPADGTWAGDRVPRTPDGTTGLLAKRPPGWEYLYFAAKLLAVRGGLLARTQSLQLEGYAEPSGEVVTDAAAPDDLQHVLGEMGSLGRVAETLFQGPTLEAAFGAPGEPGDADRIEHLVMRLTFLCWGFLDIGAKVRSADRPDHWDATFDAVARFVDRPVSSYLDWVDDLVRECDQIPGAIARGERFEINLTWAPEIGGEALAAFSAELHRVGQARGLSMG